MSVNGITGVSQATQAYQASKKKTSSSKNEQSNETSKLISTKNSSESGVIYEKSEDITQKKAAKTYKPDAQTVAKMKSDLATHQNQLKELAFQMISKQSNTYGQSQNMWKFLASGNYTVDAQTQAKAKEDISEDGYWGVKQTSTRILDFATALTGGDPDKIEEMKAAFEKGYKKAEKTWGGELPDICKQTYDAVFSGFDAMLEESN